MEPKINQPVPQSCKHFPPGHRISPAFSQEPSKAAGSFYEQQTREEGSRSRSAFRAGSPGIR